MSPSPVRASLEEGEALLRLTLARPKGNILDRAMVAALREEIARCETLPKVRTILLEGEGNHFSYGASVEEHRPEQVPQMLPEFHALFRELHRSGRVLLAAVRGQCLGGGLELATFCHRVFASPDARLGQPEIKLGVFAPIASVVLPLRLGQARADEVLLTGRTLVAEEALLLRLIDELAADPRSAALAWHREHIAPLSAAALRHAVWASRSGLGRALADDLAELERRYLSELMSTQDGQEGINAFLEKRQPQWTHH